MNIFELAYDAKAGQKGKRVFFDKEKTCGAVVRAIGSPEYNAVRAKHDIPYEVQLTAAQESNDVVEVQRIKKIVNCKAIAEYVVVELFGWEIPSKNGMIPLGNITDKKVIFKIISQGYFEPLYSWLISASASSDNFKLSHKTACELAGKLLPAGVDGGEKTLPETIGEND